VKRNPSKSSPASADCAALIPLYRSFRSIALEEGEDSAVYSADFSKSGE
jgi:hypothetical protein